MSWDIVLFNLSKKITSPEDIDDTQLIPINFPDIFKTHFKNITQDINNYSINEKDFTIDYFYDDELSSNIMLCLYGESALYSIVYLAIKNNWQIFDTALGEMIDLKNPLKKGYQNFQAYLNQITNQN